MNQQDDTVLIPIQQPKRNCTGCYFLERDSCPVVCGLGERNEWIIYIEDLS